MAWTSFASVIFDDII